MGERGKERLRQTKMFHGTDKEQKQTLVYKQLFRGSDFSKTLTRFVEYVSSQSTTNDSRFCFDTRSRFRNWCRLSQTTARSYQLRNSSLSCSHASAERALLFSFSTSYQECFFISRFVSFSFLFLFGSDPLENSPVMTVRSFSLDRSGEMLRISKCGQIDARHRKAQIETTMSRIVRMVHLGYHELRAETRKVRVVCSTSSRLSRTVQKFEPSFLQSSGPYGTYT